MKKSILASSLVIVIISLMAFDISNECSIRNGGGAPAGYSGDPAGGNLSCTTCHSGPAAVSLNGLIVSNVPVLGYTPNTTYTLTATITRAGHTKFGFQISPQNASGTFLGTLMNKSTDTKLTGLGSNYITHTSTGVLGTGLRTWNFDWISPAQGTGDVTFHGAFNVTNANNNFQGDTTYLSTLIIPEDLTVGLSNSLVNENDISVFPNPAIDLITIKSGNSLYGSTFIITDKKGKQVKAGKINSESTLVDMRELSSGLYFVLVGQQNQRIFKVLKK